LQAKHLKGLTSILLGKRELHKGHKKLPWFWAVQNTEAAGEATEDEADKADAMEFNKGKGSSLQDRRL
jgi:hypothetical protein